MPILTIVAAGLGLALIPPSSARGPLGVGRRTVQSGPTSSTTSSPPCEPACRFPRASVHSPNSGPRRREAPSPRSTATTAAPATSRHASTGSRVTWPIPSPTESSRPCAWRARSAAATSPRCSEASPGTSAKTRLCGPRSSPGNRGSATPPDWGWLRRGCCSSCSPADPRRMIAYDSTAGSALIVIGLAVTLVAYRSMIALGRLPEERRWFR